MSMKDLLPTALLSARSVISRIRAKGCLFCPTSALRYEQYLQWKGVPQALVVPESGWDACHRDGRTRYGSFPPTRKRLARGLANTFLALGSC